MHSKKEVMLTLLDVARELDMKGLEDLSELVYDSIDFLVNEDSSVQLNKPESMADDQYNEIVIPVDSEEESILRAVTQSLSEATSALK